MILTPELLATAPRRASRIVAQRLLADLVDEHVRLGAHHEALHDFRVALRRLRSWLRAYRPWLRDTVRGRTYRALAAIADASGSARDAEVALAWLAGQEFPPRAAAGVRHLVARIRRDRRKAVRTFDARVEDDFAAVVRQLGKQLASYRVDVTPDDPVVAPPMSAVVRRLLRDHAAELERAVRDVKSEDDAAAAHRARIAGKRLRYLLEPIGDPRAAGLVKRLARMQDALGELHDTHLLMDRIGRDRAALAKRPRVRGQPDPRTGLYALAAIVRKRATATHAQFARDWTECGDAILVDSARIAANA